MTIDNGWAPEVHTGLPDGFTLYRRENPKYNAAEYQVGFRATHAVTMSREREHDRDFRDMVLQDALRSLAHFIETKTKEIAS